MPLLSQNNLSWEHISQQVILLQHSFHCLQSQRSRQFCSQSSEAICTTHLAVGHVCSPDSNQSWELDHWQASAFPSEVTEGSMFLANSSGVICKIVGRGNGKMVWYSKSISLISCLVIFLKSASPSSNWWWKYPVSQFLKASTCCSHVNEVSLKGV